MIKVVDIVTEFFAEREFVALAQTRITALESGTLSLTQSAGALQDILTSAQSVKAKSVMLCARQCRDYCLSSDSVESPDSAALKHLVSLFAQGLFEIDPEARSMMNTGDLKSAMPSMNDNAAQLMELIQYAPDSNKSALRDLIRLSGESSQLRGATPEPAKQLVSLETLIAPISSQALVTAHLAYKQVSLSYACDDIAVHSDLESPLQETLAAICETLIEHCIRRPNAREQANLSGTAQISLTASDTQNGLMLDIFCDDLPLPPQALAGHRLKTALSEFSAAGGNMTVSPGRRRGALLSVTHPAPRLGPDKIAFHAQTSRPKINFARETAL